MFENHLFMCSLLVWASVIFGIPVTIITQPPPKATVAARQAMRSYEKGIYKRVEPLVLQDLRPDNCTNPFLRRIIDGAIPGGEFEAWIPHGDGDGLRDLAAGGEVDLLVLDANLALSQEIRARYLREARRGQALSSLSVLVVLIFQRLLLDIINEVALKTAHKIVIPAANFVSNALKTKTCEEGEDAPACIDYGCNGVDGKCTGLGKRGCVCHDIMYVIPGYPYDESLLDKQQKVLEMISQSSLKDLVKDSAPICNGIATQNWIQRDIGSMSIESYCSSQGSSVPAGEKREATYNSGVDQLFISTHYLTEAAVSPGLCKLLLYKVLDDCDSGNPDNPGNWKHGGSIDYQKVATVFFIPQGSPQPYCNPYGSPPGSAPWVDIGVGVDAVNQFCGYFSLVGKKGKRENGMLSLITKGQMLR
ncbi:hypothetical protein HYALB_00010763 [Hymenoscyphus albidus]|uniref:Uncharacterized protein n=1 Tax=Hymenoscyphus albidus TaxID=595503 RepID=A0A9N9Q693_9HELO|nr:hypothetical protein HYALB_00010763 [Hymenoscyphus albidus]